MPPIRETITYPRVETTSDNDSCKDSPSRFEHLLECGHLVTTTTAGEACAPNCYHTANYKHATRVTRLKATSTQNFYCDACVEVANESLVAKNLSSSEAERVRKRLRQEDAIKRNKAKNYRRCHIAQKVISVPCYKEGEDEGEVDDRYIPPKDCHPFDTALPRTGANMFEDIETVPVHSQKQGQKKGLKRAGQAQLPSDDTNSEDDYAPEDDVSSVDDAVIEDVEDTLVEGARWLQEQDELARRRQEINKLTAVNRRTAARRIVKSSSPDIGMSSSIVSNSSSPTAHSIQQSNIEPSRVSKKRKRQSEPGSGSLATAHPLKRVNPASQLSSAVRVAELTLDETIRPSLSKKNKKKRDKQKQKSLAQQSVSTFPIRPNKRV